VCSSITTAVAAFAQASPHARYTIDPAVLQRVVGDYLETHPTHNKPLNLTVTELNDTCRVDYYEMCYGTDSSGQGKFEFIPQLGRRELVDGKFTDASGSVCEGKMQYIEQLKNMYLVGGKITLPSREVQEGRWQYVEQLKGMGFVDGKVTFPSGEVQEGKRQYVEQLKGMCLVEGKITFPSGEVEEGKRQYVEQLKHPLLTEGTRTKPNGDVYSGTFAYVPGMNKDTQLVNGTLSYATGRSETGDVAYIPQLNSMKLVNGTTKNAEGEVVKEGRREYVPQKNGMMLIEGLSVFADGTRQEGTRSYVPELNEVVLTAGSITQGSKVQKGTWAYSQYEGRLVFTPTPAKPKLPQNTRNQIQSAVQELVGIQQRFDSTGKYNTSAAMLNAAAEQAKLAQNPEQFDTALQSFSAQYKTLTRELSRLTHPDNVNNYSANTHGAALQQLVDLRETIDGQVRRWSLATVDWH